ncbi:MAG: hypothetical protein AVDCRST_MAG18-3677 [uncultured Thermomicrobiales bacterium]|uniref:PspA/IM30 family protein n=1 Tax=uncultured Thermomicrobiales bacterium TaxID=1645740 RepID=A0A6J4VQG6_9BACT|nr:MAG: hypothetical protein AVDCRST_MAG18-3677 [uncultured Thermomicrobiales bacterium]
MLQRLRNIFGSIFSIFITRAEDAVPLEERLKYDRQRKAGTLKQQMDRATNIGALANEAVAELAETRAEVSGLREEAKEHVRLAQEAAARGDSDTEEREMILAAQRSDELAQAQAELARLESDVNDALANKEAAKQMVFDQADQLQQLARNDSRLVRQVQMTQMREQSLALTEEMAQVVPQDRDNLREQVKQSADRRTARYESRKELVEGLVERQQRASRASRAQISAQGRNVLAELQAEVGYTPTSATPAAAPPRATDAPIARQVGEVAPTVEPPTRTGSEG